MRTIYHNKEVKEISLSLSACNYSYALCYVLAEEALIHIQLSASFGTSF